jgi:DNA-binding transcriptional ArsR family regulator
MGDDAPPAYRALVTAADAVAERLRVLGQPVRVRTIDALARHGEQSVGALATSIGENILTFHSTSRWGLEVWLGWWPEGARSVTVFRQGPSSTSTALPPVGGRVAAQDHASRVRDDPRCL